MARAYTAPAAAYNGVAVTTDTAALNTSSSIVIEIDEMDINQSTASTVANVNMTVLRYTTASYSISSGGSAGTVAQHLVGDHTTGVTATYNNTVIASAGTSSTLYADAINIINGWQKLPAPEDRWSVSVSAALVWRLSSQQVTNQYSNSIAFRETV